LQSAKTHNVSAFSPKHLYLLHQQGFPGASGITFRYNHCHQIDLEVWVLATRRSKAKNKGQGGFNRFVGKSTKVVIFSTLVAGAIGVGYFGASLFRQLQDLPDITLVERMNQLKRFKCSI
jgi:hypothetical protein